mgnify:CR=1 FL=1
MNEAKQSVEVALNPDAEKLWERFKSGLFVAHLLFNGLARATEYQEVTI